PECVGSPLLVGVNHSLGVGARAIAVATPLELAPQLLVVVDLAVVGQPEVAGLIRHWLAALRREVEDGEPASGQRYGGRGCAGHIEPGLIGAAVGHQRTHPLYHSRGRCAAGVCDACDTAHSLLLRAHRSPARSGLWPTDRGSARWLARGRWWRRPRRRHSVALSTCRAW